MGCDLVGSLLQQLIIHLPNWQLRLTMHLRGGTNRIYMNSNSETGLASE